MSAYRIVYRPALDGRFFKVQQNRRKPGSDVDRWWTVEGYENLIFAMNAFPHASVEDRAANEQRATEQKPHPFSRNNAGTDACSSCGRPNGWGEAHSSSGAQMRRLAGGAS